MQAVPHCADLGSGHPRPPAPTVYGLGCGVHIRVSHVPPLLIGHLVCGEALGAELRPEPPDQIQSARLVGPQAAAIEADGSRQFGAVLNGAATQHDLIQLWHRNRHLRLKVGWDNGRTVDYTGSVLPLIHAAGGEGANTHLLVECHKVVLKSGYADGFPERGQRLIEKPDLTLAQLLLDEGS